jgi:hypothetical protein
LLAWEHPLAGARFRILRAEVRDERRTVEANPLLARLIRLVRRVVRPLMPDLYLPPLPEQLWVPGAYIEVGETSAQHFIDQTAEAGKRYLYYVQAEHPGATRSGPSNIVGLPLLRPPATVAEIARALDRLEPATLVARLGADLERCRAQIEAGALAAALSDLTDTLRHLEAADILQDRQAQLDLLVLLRKLARRTALAAEAGIAREALIG